MWVIQRTHRSPTGLWPLLWTPIFTRCAKGPSNLAVDDCRKAVEPYDGKYLCVQPPLTISPKGRQYPQHNSMTRICCASVFITSIAVRTPTRQITNTLAPSILPLCYGGSKDSDYPILSNLSPRDCPANGSQTGTRNSICCLISNLSVPAHNSKTNYLPTGLIRRGWTLPARRGKLLSTLPLSRYAASDIRGTRNRQCLPENDIHVSCSTTLPVFFERGGHPLAVFSILLTLAGDIESNPGLPAQYTCPVCSITITSAKRTRGSVQCSTCKEWIHTLSTTLTSTSEHTPTCVCDRYKSQHHPAIPVTASRSPKHVPH
jgi:hypothetical protein